MIQFTWKHKTHKNQLKIAFIMRLVAYEAGLETKQNMVGALPFIRQHTNRVKQTQEQDSGRQ